MIEMNKSPDTNTAVKPVSVALDEATRQTLADLASDEQRSRSQIVRRAVRDYDEAKKARESRW